MEYRYNISEAKERVDSLLKLCGEKVSLIAISKSFSYKYVAQLVQCCRLSYFGENYIQEAVQKIEFVKHSISDTEDIQWHMLGHLQTNKVRLAVQYFSVIQSVDSVALLDKINEESRKIDKIQKCLLQIKVSEEIQKYGMTEADMKSIIDTKDTWSNVKICGMMVVASMPSDIEKNRNEFKKAKGVFKRLFRSTDVLSMGMTNDYQIAMEEGSSMIRIGTGIFGQRPKNLRV